MSVLPLYLFNAEARAFLFYICTRLASNLANTTGQFLKILHILLFYVNIYALTVTQ